MQFSTLPTLLALTATTLAQFDQQSDPFTLSLGAGDEKYFGKGLIACHEGAAIEGLCVSANPPNASSPNEIYTFNTTGTSQPDVPGSGPPGYLTWELQGAEFTTSSPLQLVYLPTTNVALALFEPASSGNVLMAFDSRNNLGVLSGFDDTVSPPTVGANRNVMRWAICKQNQLGYQYEQLSWIMGEGEPQNPSCVEVQVRREMVEQ